MRLILVALFQICMVCCFAQTKEVTGRVVDSTGLLPVRNVFITLKSNWESLNAKSDSSGNFVFKNVGSTRFELIISGIGFEENTRYFTIDKPDKEFSVGDIVLKTKITLLPEVVLTPTNPITFKEDTIEYRTDGYKVRDEASVEDVLKKLPGISVDKHGVVTAQGVDVSRVRVNGKDYFGGDIVTATKNLPANIVESIQIIDDYGDKANLTGAKGAESEKILNINIQKGKNKGSFGNATGASGTRSRYLGNLSFNSFKEQKQLSFIGSFNNVNANSFDFSGGMRGGGSGAFDLGSGQSAGYGETVIKSGGVNYRDIWGKKITTYGSYSYSSRRNTVASSAFQQDFNPVNINSTKSNNETQAISYSHRLTWNWEYKIDTLNYLKFSPYVAYSSSKTHNDGDSEFRKPQYYTLNNGSSFTKDEAPSWGTDVFYLHKFKRRGRNFSLATSINFSGRDRARDVRNEYYNVDSSAGTATVAETYQNQAVWNDNITTNANFRVSYNEPVGKTSTLEASYAWNNSYSETIRIVDDIDFFTGSTVRNNDQSNDYNYQFITNRLGLSVYNYKLKYSYQVGMVFQPSELTGRDTRRNVVTEYTAFNIAPSLRFTYKFSRTHSLTASYVGNSREPGFNQLQPVVDSSNIKNIIIGNPFLKPEFTNRYRLQYSKAGMETGNTFFGHVSFDQTHNKIVGSRVNEPGGTGRTTSFLNTNGFYSLNGSMSFSKPLAKKKLLLAITSAGGYTNNVSFTDNQKNTGGSWMLTPGANLRMDLPDVVELNIFAKYVYHRNTTRYFTYSYTSDVQSLDFGIDGKNYFFKDWTAGYDFTKNIYIGYMRGFNASRNLLNVYVERRFLKNNKGLLRIQGFDLFDQNTSLARSISATTITDVQNNRLSRYFLLSFNYRFQNFGK